jgi:hypothetical protein
MAVYVSNIVIEQGFDFSSIFELADSLTDGPLNLVGYGVTAQIRKNYTSSSAVSFTSTITDPVNGEIKISLTDTQTSALKSGRHVYDVAIQYGGFSSNEPKIKVVEGTALVRPGVTR